MAKSAPRSTININTLSVASTAITFLLAFFAAFLRGLVTGVVVSVPTGPVNVAVIRNGIAISVEMGVFLGAGAACVDSLYSLLAYLGLVPLVTRVPWVEPLLAAVGCVLMIVYGVFSVWRPHGSSVVGRRPQTARARAFGLGALMTFANPAPLLAWVGIASATMVGLTVAEAIIFSIGVLAGGVGWFFVLAVLAQRGTMKSGRRAAQVTRFVGVLLVGFGIYLGVRAYVKAAALM